MRKDRGFALIFTLCTVLLIALIMGTFFIIASNDLSMAATACNTMRAYYVADAGMAKKFTELRSGNTSNLSETFTLATGNTGTYSVNVVLVQGGVFATYRLDSTGTYKNINKTVKLTVRQISCARFAYLSNSEDLLYWWGSRPIWFVTGDILRGPLHSNDQLNISGDPIFDGPVSSSASTINYNHGGPPDDNPDFRQTLTLGAPTIQLPTAADILNNIRTYSQQPQGLYLTGNSAITLLPDGSVNVTNSDKGWNNHNMSLPQNNSIFVENGYVDISGTLNGQLTVGTNRSIYIVNSILYQHDPRTDPLSTDILGLVAQNNVYVDANAPYNIEIDAYIVALNTSFGVENYTGPLKGVLTIYGGITQERRGPIGTFNSSTNEKISGYTKDYNYDTRLNSMAPVYFPPAVDSNNRIIYLKILWSED